MNYWLTPDALVTLTLAIPAALGTLAFLVAHRETTVVLAAIALLAALVYSNLALVLFGAGLLWFLWLSLECIFPRWLGRCTMAVARWSDRHIGTHLAEPFGSVAAEMPEPAPMPTPLPDQATVDLPRLQKHGTWLRVPA